MITVKKLQKDGSMLGVEIPVDCFVMRDCKRWSNEFTEIIANRLHCFEKQNELDLNTCTAKEITDAQEGWVSRYQNDPIFRAKVESIVAVLIQVVNV